MRIKKTPGAIWAEYNAGTAYNNNMDLYETVKQNENFFVGRQWEGVNAPDLDKPVMNILKRVVSFFLSSIVSDDVTAKVSSFSNDPAMQPVLEAANDQFDEIVEQTALKAKNREVLRNAAVDGDGCLHFYFAVEEGETLTAETPAELLEKASAEGGHIEAEVIENTHILFGNPQVWDVQKQPYVLLVYRKLIDSVRRQARENGLPDNDITADDDPHGIHTQDENGKVTVVRKYWKENGKVHCMEVTQNAVIMEEKTLGYALYPLAYISWDKVKNSYHGQAAITSLIPNQIFINKLYAMAMQHMKQAAFPTVIYNKQMLPNGWNNRVGAAIGTLGNPNEAVAANFRPADMSAQVLQMIDATITHTKDAMGASDAALGNVRPDNTSAIIATQKATAMPLELQKMDFYRFVEDCMRIFLDMMSVNYGTRVVWLADERTGEQKATTVDFDTLKGKHLKLNIDVGASTYWSELMQISTVDNLFMKGIIKDPKTYLESVPKGYVPNRQKLLDELQKERKLMEEQMAAEQEAMQANMQGGLPQPQNMSPMGADPMAAIPPELLMQMMG